VPRIQDHEHWLFLVWLVITGFTAFGLLVCWNEGLVQLLVDSDRSRISLVIGVLYVIASGHCASRALALSREADEVGQLNRFVGKRVALMRADAVSGVSVEDHQLGHHSIVAEYLAALIRRADGQGISAQDGEQSTLVGTLVARAKGSHDLGWFMVDVLLKLGLLGTIVGFILMLGSVADTSSLDVNTMQKVLRQMSNGMGTALYTTLAGLVGSMSLGLQYLLLDKAADDLIERILRMTESRLAVA